LIYAAIARSSSTRSASISSDTRTLPEPHRDLHFGDL